MYMLLLFVVLLAVLLSPVAASSPIMELTPPGSPLAQPLLDIDELFMCQFCRMQYELCWCMMPQYDPTPFIPDYGLVDTPLPQPRETEVDLTPVHDYVTGHAKPLLNDEYMQYMDDNETTVQPNTVLVHIGETYTPGDRSSSHLPKPKRRPHRRQAPRNRGFVCNQVGCNEAFNRQCDLNRHQRTTHLSERPHVCPTCNKGFLYPKDLRRHERRHSDPSSPMDTFHCEHPDCTNLAGFSRKDNLMRHKRNQHQEQ